MAVNIIRDTLNTTFNLFVTDVNEYTGSPFQRFVKLIGLIMRQQLTSLVAQSLDRFHAFMLVFKQDAPEAAAYNGPLLRFKIEISGTDVSASSASAARVEERAGARRWCSPLRWKRSRRHSTASWICRPSSTA